MSNGRAEFDAQVDAVWTELTAPKAGYEVQTTIVRGHPIRTFAAAPRDLMQIWSSTAGHGHRTYLVYGEDRISYGAAHAAVSAAACWMARMGVKPGDRVAVAMRNYPEWLLAFWASLKIGATVVGLNAWWIADELAFALEDCAPSAVFCDGERWERLQSWAATAPDVPIVTVRAPVPDGCFGWGEVVSEPVSAMAHDPDPDDDACIFYTSGTTGSPKGARLTHRGCVNTVVGIGFVTDLTKRSDGAPGAPVTEAPLPVALVTTPLFHVTGNNSLALPVTAAGGTLVLMRKWDAGEALRLVEHERVTAMSGVPTMARELLAHPDALNRDLSSLLTLSGGGAPVPPDLVARVVKMDGPMQPSTGFGMTETCGLVSGIAGLAYQRRPTSCGRAIPTFEVKIVGDAGETLSAGAVGELCVRGAGVVKGYLNRPEATAEAIVDGWLHTGDVAYIDEAGYIFVVDRKKDMVLRGGENVYCAEVEAAFYRHPAVAEACVFGLPDERLGEEVGVAIFLREGEAASPDELLVHAAALIAAFKVPRRLWITDLPLPRNANGKFLRRNLRAMLLNATS